MSFLFPILGPQRAFWPAVAIRWLNQAEHHGFVAACHDATAPKLLFCPSFFDMKFWVCLWNPLQVFNPGHDSIGMPGETGRSRDWDAYQIPLSSAWTRRNEHDIKRDRKHTKTSHWMSDEEPQVTQVVSLWAQRATLEELRAWCVDSFWPPWNRMAIQRRLSKEGRKTPRISLSYSFLDCICL